MLARTLLLAGLLLTATGCATQHSGAIMPIRYSTGDGPLRIAVIGLVHQHVEGLLWQANSGDTLRIVGIYEPNRALFDRMATKYGLDARLRYDDIERMLDETKPEAASVMTSIRQHRRVVEACAPRGIHTLHEKPLAFCNADARAMAALAQKHGVLVLTNYESSWYASVREAKRLLDSGKFAALRRMVFRHGHKGPREIGCNAEFLAWLTDPRENGGGAIVDFGCYGAILATWLTGGERPIAVSAQTAQLKPEVYPLVDDDATIVVTYRTCTATIQASWAWTHDNKEMDLYAEGGSIHAGRGASLETCVPDGARRIEKTTPTAGSLEKEWTYLRDVVRGKCPVDPLSSLELNLIAVEILDAARRDAARRRE
ncbi:MAG: Gfo/Idh/MocA family protein [Phycisphaerae bacterium]